MMTTELAVVAGEEDAALVNASLAGDREAFGRIVSRYQSLVCSLAYSATGSLSQSEDLAQDTFIAAWRQLAGLREPEKLRAWICGIARNLINNFLRRQGREPSHRAAPLEEMGEPRSTEPLPAERAISSEEAGILWHALEQIPETYREPLILFYREHQSVEAVAQALELTEDAVKQRLSRGRKLLQEQVLAFVEGALERTKPGTRFTLAVVAALPLFVTSAKAATAATAVAKGGAGAKSAVSLGVLGGLLGMVGAALFAWKTAADETRSPRERQLVVRMGWIQITMMVLTLGAAFYALPKFAHEPVTIAVAVSALVLANVIGAVCTTQYLARRKIQIQMEEGPRAEEDWALSDEELKRKTLRKSLRQIVPFLILMLVGSIALPWKEHWVRSAAVVAGEALIIFWAFRRFLKLQRFEVAPRNKPSWVFGLILLPAIIFGSALLAGLLPFFIRPETAKAEIIFGPLMKNLMIGLLVAALVYGVVAAILIWKRKTMGSLGPILTEVYSPLLQQLQLTPEQGVQFNGLVEKKMMAGVNIGISLLNRRLDAAGRTEMMGQVKSQSAACDEEIRQLLGEDNFQVFQKYDKTVPDRTLVGLFEKQSGGKSRPLGAEQQDQLIQALGAARAQVKRTVDFNSLGSAQRDILELLTNENLAQFEKEEEQFAEAAIPEAARILEPGQLAAFQKFLEKQRRTQIAGFKMAARMLAWRKR